MKCPGCGGRELEPDGDGLLRCEGCGEIIDGGPAWGSFAVAPAEPASETAVAPPHGDAPVADHALQQWQAAVQLHGTSGRTLLLASQEIERLDDALRLPTRVRESALELFSEALRRKLVRGRQTERVAAALTYAAIRQERLPLTMDDVAAASGLGRLELGRLYRTLARGLELKVAPQAAADFLPRFAKKLQLADETARQAHLLLRQAADAGYGQGMRPGALAGAALYLACREAGEPRSQKQVAQVAGITEVTVRTRYQELSRLLSK